MSKKRSNGLFQGGGLKRILKKCSSLGKHEGKGSPEDVPEGHFVVYVGQKRSRFILSISWLSHPKFQTLLHEAEEEYGFNHERGIMIPCNELLFQYVISHYTTI